MQSKSILKNPNGATYRVPDDSPKTAENSLVKIQGRLTSNIRTRASSNTPYYAFLWLERCVDCHNTKEICQALTPKHKSCQECAKQKCQDCEIPIIFRWINKLHQLHEMEPKEVYFKPSEHWQNPNLTKGQRLLLQGNWAKSDHSSRPSSTVYSFQKLND